MKLIAPAKLTLFLSVGAREPSGLHELVSVMQAVSLFDEVDVEQGPFSLTVEPPDAAPAGEENLAARAARAAAAAIGVEPAVSLHLLKRIPAAAGLGGGSSDAAAALVGVNDLLGKRLSRKALGGIAASLGSDVPFCVRGGTGLVAGTGEEVIPLPIAEALWWVLGISDAALPTADVYAEFDRLGGGTIADPHELADALARGDLAAIARTLRNDLEPAALSLMPALAEGADALRSAGALGVVLCGSGPTWAGLARDESDARRIAAGCSKNFARVEVVRSVEHGPRGS